MVEGVNTNSDVNVSRSFTFHTATSLYIPLSISLYLPHCGLKLYSMVDFTVELCFFFSRPTESPLSVKQPSNT